MKNNTLIVTAFYPPLVGGLEGYWQEVARRWQNGKCFVFTNPSQQDNQDHQEKFEIIRKPIFSWTWFKPSWLPLLWEIGAIVEKKNITRIIFGHYANYVVLGPILKKMYGIKFDIMTHGIDTMIPQRKFITNWLLKKNLLSAENIYANSTLTAGVLSGLINHKKDVKIAHPAIDYGEYPDIDVVKYKKEKGLENKFIILSITRLVPIKGIDLVLKTLAKIKDNSIKYIIVGAGPELIPLKKMVNDNDLNDQVDFIGQIRNEPKEKAPWYSIADLFIQINRPVHDQKESFGVVFLEAARYHKPVIASNNTGAVDIIDNNKSGMLVNPDDIDNIAQSIKKLKKNHSLAQEMGYQLNEKVKNNFNWHNTLEVLNGL